MRAIRALVSEFPRLALDTVGISVVSDDGGLIRRLRDRAKAQGFDCSMVVTTDYTREDALLGELGWLTGAGSDQFRASLPKDAFNFTSACTQCGLGGVQVKPYLLAERAITCKGPFYIVPQEAFRIMMRAEIGLEMVEATGSPNSLRHPVTRSGKVVREWVEPVPTATMPPLSPKSEGIIYKDAETCSACGRAAWDHAEDVSSRLVYSRAAIANAQKHAVVAMHEPFARLPEFDRGRRVFKKPYGLPLLLFSRAAVKVLAKYIEPDKGFPAASTIEPVFAE